VHVTTYDIAVVGGTGPQGKGLAYRWSRHGHRVVLGSRSAERAQQAAGEISARLPEATVSGATNADASAGAEVVVLAVPYDGHDDLVASLAEQLDGKVVISCVNPLGFDKQGAYALQVEEGSAAQQAAALLPDSTVVGAFHNVSAVLLDDPDVDKVDTDVLVLGDVREATDLVQALAGTIPGVRGIFGGRLRNAHQVEAFTANLISINRRHKAHSGLRVTDV
jgi:8-hydroxy-5-deazaflavin:NADPH oxidoreductase